MVPSRSRFGVSRDSIVELVVVEVDGAVNVDNSSVGGSTIWSGAESSSREHPAASSGTSTPMPAPAIQRRAPGRWSLSPCPPSPYHCTVATPKIVLFYVFTPLPDPEAIRLWQQAAGESTGVTGRVIVSPHGINATVGGDISAVKQYVRATKRYAPFAGADIKWSEGTGSDFPRLSVKTRPEIVTFGVPGELEVDENGVVGGGTRLTPEQLHELVADKGDDVVFFDGRNAIEAQVGRFKNAVVPPADTTRDFVPLLDSGAFDDLKDRTVVTYCTGGVRCEVLTRLMKARGFGDVYQLDGGIARYGETFGDDGLWEGSMFVFDDRMTVDFSDHTEVIGRCSECGAPTSHIENYPDRLGRELRVVCPECVPPERASTADAVPASS